MRDGWERVPLGQVFDTTNIRLGEHAEEPDVFSVTKYDGFVPADEYFGKRIASAKLDTYKVVEPDEWAYSTIHIDEGSIARNRLGRRGVVSPMYTTMRLKSNRVHPYYAELLLRSPWMLARYSDAQQGSINRRRSLPWKVFAGLTIPVPPLHEQRRIVDLIGALDDTIATLSDGIDKAGSARGFLLQGLLHRLSSDTPSLPLGELGEFTRGRRFTKADYVEEAGLGCIHYGQVHTHFGSVATETLTFIPETMKPRMRLASPGDVVVAATSENAEDLGKATVWMGNDEIAVHDDCQIFRHRLDPRFASHLFATEAFNRQKLQYAAGTKVTRISGDNLARITVPVPDSTDQRRIGQTMSDLDDTLSAMRGSRSRLRSLRSNLLTALLSGEHEIPESYDEVMEATA